MRLLTNFVISALVLFSLPIALKPVHAAELSEVVSALEKSYGALTDVQADFVQQTEIVSMKRKEKGAGELFLKKGPGGQAMFRFNYSKPKQQIISNGKKVWYYLPETKQVMVSDVAALFSGNNGVALNYLMGMGHVSRDFNIKFAGDGRDKKGNFVLELTPKKSSPAMAKLQLTVEAKAVEIFAKESRAATSFPITSSVVLDSSGNRTAIEFNNVRVNRDISNDRFNFKIPSGVEVVNPGQQ